VLVLLLVVLLAIASVAGYLILTEKIVAGEKQIAEGQKQLEKGQIKLDEGKAKLLPRAPVEHLVVESGQVAGVRMSRGKVHRGDAVVVATGGASYSATGSTGDGYRLAESVGHTIVPIRPALVPLETAADGRGAQTAADVVEGLSPRGDRASPFC
jgi:predicted flavoprotein YhiN